MSKGVNKVILVGNLGQDPDVRHMPSGGSVANISVATSETWKDKQTGEKKERTEWHRVVFFNRLAEVVGEYLGKGSKVYVEGSLRTRKWQDQSGQDRYTTEVVAAEMQMLNSRGSGGQSGGARGTFGQESYPEQAQQGSPQQAEAGSPPSAYQPADPYDDDIPF